MLESIAREKVTMFFAVPTIYVALLNLDVAPEQVASIRYWCLPVTFGTLAVLGVFTSLLLIRTRIGRWRNHVFKVGESGSRCHAPFRFARLRRCSRFFCGSG